MGIAERREREKSRRRRDILDCTRELILRRGVERVSMEDIARGTELSKATLYLYFPGKEIIFNEICEESARAFLDYLKQDPQDGGTGIEALRRIWQGYVELFGKGDEMLVIFRVRSFLNNWLPSDLKGEIASPNIDAIVRAIRAIIEQCKNEGIFDPGLNSALAVRLMLSLFSTIVGNAAGLPEGERSPRAMAAEMTEAFRIVVRGLAREGVEHSRLEIARAT